MAGADGVKAPRLNEAETEKEFATQSPHTWSKPCGYSSSAARAKYAQNVLPHLQAKITNYYH